MWSNARLAEVQQRAETWKDIVKESCRSSTDTNVIMMTIKKMMMMTVMRRKREKKERK